jgi:hypothetical protein
MDGTEQRTTGSRSTSIVLTERDQSAIEIIRLYVLEQTDGAVRLGMAGAVRAALAMAVQQIAGGTSDVEGNGQDERGGVVHVPGDEDQGGGRRVGEDDPRLGVDLSRESRRGD